jgi:hypothetical protein
MMTHHAFALPAGLRELRALLAESGHLDDLPASPQWEATASLASRHHLGPAVFPRFVQIAEGSDVLAPCLRSLWWEFLAARFTAQKIYEDAVAVLDKLVGAGIRVIALKGLHLVSGGYAEPGSRPMGDIDLLVPPDQVWQAWSVLRKDGFIPATDIDEAQAGLFPLHLPRLVKPHTTPIELHRAITSPLLRRQIAVEGLWQRSRPLVVGPHTIAGLCAEDLLLHLCMHATHQHRCQVPLRCIHDISQVIQGASGGVGWAALLEIARISGTERPLFCGLLLAEQLFSAPVPADVLQSLVPGANRAGILAAAMDSIMHFDTPAGPLARLRVAPGLMPARIANAARELFSGPEIIASTTRADPLLSRLRAYWRLFAKVAARNREFSARLASGDPGARAEMRVARSIASIESWMAE